MTAPLKPATTISENGIKLIKEFEGLVLHPYKDKVGKSTIGYGTTEYENGVAVKITDKAITKERADQLLRFEANAKAYVLNQSLINNNIRLNQNQFDSLCSFAYNAGIYGLLGSTLFAMIKANPNNQAIRSEFMKWDHGHVDGKLVVIDDLKMRRKKESDLYFS